MTLSWGWKGGLKVLLFRKKSREEELGAREKERREHGEEKGVKRPLNTEEGPVKKSGRKKAVPEDSEEEGEGFGDDDEANDPSPGNADGIVEEGGRV